MILTALLAAAFLTVPTDEKAKERDLSLLVSFDRHSVRADFAKGSPNAITLTDLDLGLRGLIGFDTQSAFKPDPGESLKFAAKGNFDPHRGTLVLWTMADDYNPCDAKTDGKERGNVIFAHLVAHAADGRDIGYFLYECDDEIFFDWAASPNAWSWGNMGRTHGQRKGIKKGEWHQIAATWDDDWLCLYLNGELLDRGKMPSKADKYRDLQPDETPASFIGVRSETLGDKHAWGAGIDDFAIYSRVKSPIEIRNAYLKLLKDRGTREIRAYDITLNGVVTSDCDPCDRLEAEFDFAALPEKAAKAYEAGKLEMAWSLTGPDGAEQKGVWRFKKGETAKLLNGIVKPGKWRLKTETCGEKVAAEIVKPEMPWLGNGIGNEDEVPAIWKPHFKLAGRTVDIWNRRYQFGAGPLPEKVFAYGREIVSRRPRLLVDGEEPIWTAGQTTRTNREIVFNGRGTVGLATVTYATTVAFDGLITFAWTIDGRPSLSSMTLDWQVSPENRQFLLTPTLCEAKEDPQAFTFPTAGSHPRELWLVSEKKGGFAFMTENDANWVYDPEKPVWFVDRRTGDCRVEIIGKSVAKMPEATPYRVLFIATPTRPLPKENRVIRYGEYDAKGKPVTHGGGDGMLDTVFTHKPRTDGSFERMYSKFRDNCVVPYGGMKSLTDAEPETAYFNKYWSRPGATTYTMPYWTEKEPGKRVRELRFGRPTCASTVYADYYVWCDWKLWTHPLACKFWESYNDLCGVGFCRNPYHGCRYTDKFGRDIQTLDVFHTRKLILRLVSLAHRYGKILHVHGQRDFFPFVQGLADYWLPGEQFTALVRRNYFGYTDDVPEAIWRSEHNRDVIGIGIVHDMALGQQLRPYTTKPQWKYTWALLAVLAANDIEPSCYCCAPAVVNKHMDILERYGIGDAKTVAHRYYEPDALKGTDPAVKLTWYDCPDGAKLLVAANYDTVDHTTEVDVTKLGLKELAAYDEISERAYFVRGGKFSLKVPTRAYALVGLPPKVPKGGRVMTDVVPVFSSEKPTGGDALKDDFTAWKKSVWSTWKGAKSTAVFTQRGDDGHAAPGALSLTKGRGVFLRRFPVKPGAEYTATVWVKAKGCPAETKVSMTFQAQDAKTNFLHLKDFSSEALASDCADWRRLTVTFTVPTDGRWKECAHELLTIGADVGAGGELLIDDFQWVGDCQPHPDP